MQWWKPRQSSEIEPKPWLSPNAIQFFEGILSPDFHVLEFGAGGSTLWLAERVATVESYEPIQNWREAVRERAGDNVTLLQEPDFSPTGYYDVIFIDGEPVKDRAEWLFYAAIMTKPGGWIILDNANRPEYIEERAMLGDSAELVYTANGNEGGTRYLVTEFWRLHETGNEPTQDSASRETQADSIIFDTTPAKL